MTETNDVKPYEADRVWKIDFVLSADGKPKFSLWRKTETLNITNRRLYSVKQSSTAWVMYEEFDTFEAATKRFDVVKGLPIYG
jgi:hypothetical protein